MQSAKHLSSYLYILFIKKKFNKLNNCEILIVIYKLYLFQQL